MAEPGRTVLAPGVSVATRDLRYEQSLSGGAGGQHVNKTNSRVLLRVHLRALRGLDYAAQQRLRDLLGSRLVAGDDILLRCDETRSASRNRELVLERLQQVVAKAKIAPRKRRATRPTRGSVERRLEGKRQHAQKKTRRRNDLD
ncbi:MAG: alternative ribosome rescue aminoacyl-tRNA hydrolase ArfB [Planctomycetota bacterium]|jgi:ribosome-associated protein|nr:alternative ribosome rescue aminoacyl-tRNA hydrolase ArfB [Planctomycetota bacterium]